MVAYTISNSKTNDSGTRATLHLKGAVTAADWEKLRELFIDILKTNDQLVLNVENIAQYDESFSVLICLLRRTVHLLSKQLTIIGKPEELFSCVYEAAMQSRKQTCSYPGTFSCCLWDNLFRPALIQ